MKRPASTRLPALAFGLAVLLLAGPLEAKPAHKQSLKKYYGQYLSTALHQCATCHLRQDEVPDPADFDEEAPPHNPFGIRLRDLGEELEAESKPADIISRLKIVAEEDADGDGATNELEILSSHQPGREADKPSEEELRAAADHKIKWLALQSSYPWEPFNPVARPAAPAVNADWIRGPIDAFIAEEHARHGLHPRPEAARHVLLRRVYLDLIGLPPTRDELHAFLADQSPDAYERLVDRLLANPAYGERWGRHWMDVWRYSDWAGWTDGKQIRDSQPHIWRWRDWIIESLNQDKGYDQMVLEMLAADEAAPTDDDALRATGFLARNYKMLSRETWMQETVEHTAKAFLGITLACARCHDHMYDPISQAEYYQVRAIFEPYNVRLDRLAGQPDTTLDGLARVFDSTLDASTYLFVRGDDRNPDKDHPIPPGVPAAFIGPEFSVAPVSLPAAAYYPGLKPYIREELQAAAAKAASDAANRYAQAEAALNDARAKLAEVVAAPAQGEQVILADDFSAARSDVWEIGPGQWTYSDGHIRQEQSGEAEHRLVSVVQMPTDFSVFARFRITGGEKWRSAGLSFGFTDADNASGVYVSANAGEPKVQIFERKAGESSYPAEGRTPSSITTDREYVLQVDVQGTLVNVSLDGRLLMVHRLPPEHQPGRLSIWTYDAQAEFFEVRATALPQGVSLLAAKPESPRGPVIMTIPAAQRAVADAEAARALADKHRVAALAELASIDKRIAADSARFASSAAEDQAVLCSAASQAERDAALAKADEQVLHLAQQLDEARRLNPSAVADLETKLAEAAAQLEQSRAAVSAASETYSPLGEVFPATSSGRRLALARWLIDRKNPLSARVAANHIWLRHFGRGIVESTFDFGQNGKPPSHPALLDWLAAELMEPSIAGTAIAGTCSDCGSGSSDHTFAARPWSMKHLHRLIVTSGAYRMASTPDDACAGIDPENRYLWRMPTHRMEAEVVRDSVLYVSGRLDQSFSGPDIDEHQGMEILRRSVYFRHAAEKQMPFLKLFDGAAVTECYERKQSIMPQQALALANSELSLISARQLARTLAAAAGDDSSLFVTAAFEQVLSRQPTEAESQACQAFLDQRIAAYNNNVAPAADPANETELKRPAADPRLRARENLVHVLLNHNDFVTIR